MPDGCKGSGRAHPTTRGRQTGDTPRTKGNECKRDGGKEGGTRSQRTVGTPTTGGAWTKGKDGGPLGHGNPNLTNTQCMPQRDLSKT